MTQQSPLERAAKAIRAIEGHGINWTEICEFPDSWLSDGNAREFVFWNSGEAVFGKVTQSTRGPLFWSSRQSGRGDDYGYELHPSHFALILPASTDRRELAVARAALSAVRNPNQRMINVGGYVINQAGTSAQNSEKAQHAFSAMIGASLIE